MSYMDSLYKSYNQVFQNVNGISQGSNWFDVASKGGKPVYISNVSVSDLLKK